MKKEVLVHYWINIDQMDWYTRLHSPYKQLYVIFVAILTTISIFSFILTCLFGFATVIGIIIGYSDPISKYAIDKGLYPCDIFLIYRNAFQCSLFGLILEIYSWSLFLIVIYSVSIVLIIGCLLGVRSIIHTYIPIKKYKQPDEIDPREINEEQINKGGINQRRILTIDQSL